MKRVCPIAAVALVIFLSSIARIAEAGRLVMPMAVTARLCPVGTQTCHAGSLASGADLTAFVDKHREPGKSYDLALQLPAGEFTLRETWVIDGVDVPESIRRLTMSGSPPSTRLTGAQDLESLRARAQIGSDGIAVIDLPRHWRDEVAMKRRYSSEEPGWPILWDAHGTLRLARWPRNGWAEFTASGPALANSIHAGNAAPLAAWRDERAAWALGFFQFGWHAAYAPLDRIDIESRDLSMIGHIRYGIGSAGRYRILNLRSELREPGDYAVDAAGKFHLMPRGPLNDPSLRLTILSTPLLRLANVRSVELNGIDFVATRGDGIVVDRSIDVALTRMRFEGVGRAGVVVNGGRDVRIRNSSFEDLGDEAVILRGGDRATLESSGHLIENCRITRPSQRLLTPGAAVRLEGVGHTVRRTVVEDAPHSAIYFDGNDHDIDANWFERICLEVDDAGAIYAGRDWTARGTVIRNNVFSSIHAARPGGTAVAIYLDDMLSGIHIENNAFVDVDYGVLVGGGRDNVIEHNLFLRTKMSVHVDERALTWARKAAAPGEVMEQRLNAMPTRSARWQSAYPGLASMTRDQAALPSGNRVRDNVAAATGDPEFVTSAVAAGNLVAPRALPLSADLAASDIIAHCARSTACRPFDAQAIPVRAAFAN